MFGELAFRGEALFECVVPGKNRSTESGGKAIGAVVLPWGGPLRTKPGASLPVLNAN